MKVLFVYSNPTCSCTRKCTFELSKGLAEHVEKSDFILFSELTDKIYSQYDAIILQRLGINGVHIDEKWIYKLRLYKMIYKNVKLLYQFDDLLFSKVNEELMSIVDAIVVSNETFDKYIVKYDKKIFYLNTFVTPEDFNSRTFSFDNNKYNILWASTGSLGARLMSKVLPILKAKLPNAYIHYIGQRGNLFQNNTNVRTYGIVNYNMYISIMKACDLIINPIVKEHEIDRRFTNDFLDSKCPVKYLESAMCKKPFLTSITFPYEKIIKNGVNCISITENDPQIWVNNILDLKMNKKKSQIISDNAYNDVIENYTTSIVAKKLLNFIITLKN